jgi:Glycosyltransferase
MKNINIALLVYDISLTGGAERVALNLATEFSDLYETHLISLFDERNIFENIYPFNTCVLFRQTVSISLNLLSLSCKLRRYIQKNKINVLVSITAGVVTVANFATAKTNVQVIYAEHSNLENKTYGKKHEFRQLIGAKFSDAIVTLTNQDKNNFLKKYKISERKVCTIPNWFVSNTRENKEYNIQSKKIISVGRLEKVKGYNYLIEVAKKVYLKFPDWKWDIYGEGSLHEEIQKQVDQKKLNNFIKLKGNVKDVLDIYNNYSIFVMTSLYEGLPMVLLEAQSAGLPVVSFNCPTGPSEIVENGVNGIIVQSYDVEKMAEVLGYLMDNKELRKYYASNARINLHRYDKENVMKKWVELFEKI